MIKQSNKAPFSQRQLRVGELIKQSLGQIFLRDEAKLPCLETKNITVTEVRMSPDLKNARAYVIPLEESLMVVFPLLIAATASCSLFIISSHCHLLSFNFLFILFCC